MKVEQHRVDTTSVGVHLGGRVLGVVAIALAIGWTAMGSVYYQRMLPFYDSLAYQDSFVRTVERANEISPWTAVREVWSQPSNVALFKLFAATFGRLLPASKEALYVYLFGIHFLGLGALVALVRRNAQSVWLAVFAAAAWLAARPFKEAINGILDQRMDLASGSFCLLVAALYFGWARRPGVGPALIAGIASALAVLHRPVMALTVAGIAVIFIVRALARFGIRSRSWWKEVCAMVLPGLVLTLPWLMYHAEGLKFYYLIWNVDVGSAKTFGEAAGFNLRWLAGERTPSI